MGRRDYDEVASAEESTADKAMRRLLAEYGHPAPLVPPADLTARVLAHLPDQPPSVVAATVHTVRRRWQWMGSLVGLMLVSLLSLGIWGVFGNSSGPSSLVGGIASNAGEFMLVLVLAAKPLMHVLLSSGMLVIVVGMLIITMAAWLWWHMLQRVPLASPASGL